MSVYQKVPTVVHQMAKTLLNRYSPHLPLVDAGVTFDILFAFPSEDSKGIPKGDAITHHGVKALGLAKIISLKDRVAGRSDGEILLDGDWWDTASTAEREALLDHELHHFSVKIDKRGLVRDDHHRPVLQLRQHDFEVGWFREIAQRHGVSSIEQKQAAAVMLNDGQYFWPEIAAAKLIEMPNTRMQHVAKG